jgi:dsRNA-specific ribonuclease
MPSNGIIAPPSIPSQPSELPSVDDKYKSQIYTHSSNISSRDPVPYNRLAMFGDAHLTAAVTRILFTHSPSLDPGEMTELRNVYVSNVNVARWGHAYGFDKLVNVANHLVLSSENIDRFAAASFEAYLGAVVLSSSQKDLEEFIEKLVTPGLKDVRKSLGLNNNKSMSDRNALQKLHQKLTAEGKALPDYKHEWIGGVTEGFFEVRCSLDGKEVARGQGRSIIEGKRRAAEQVLHKPARFFTSLPDVKR